ncbi:zinc finger and btb domain-containing protein 48 [Diplodia corticola]|uniref:Zinc finger and btb domain-containing protein 48 n=1 Tax=Diplodia corticola TaxID=236234 RepID=A0A1J9QYE1_9PEZI|nr:zinc finger and btb domain-containing protein 48 [Diplodia corticola]OJD33393.1 zinc finger and btb domain-containing protein 48 [Diplodia corticola]
MAFCNVCQKSFKTDQALRQHNEDSPAHQPARCEPCNKQFPNQEALAQHAHNSPAHKGTHTCQPCQRTFPNPVALAQHVKDSPGHASSPPRPSKPPTTTITTSTSTPQATTPPNTDQPHRHRCNTCTRTFATPSALHQHARDSHASPTHPCPHCPRRRSFRSASALAQHIRDSPSHDNDSNKNKTAPPPTTTPLDAFFHTYPTFPYDRALPASESWRRLCAHMGWKRNASSSSYSSYYYNDNYELYVSALRRELEVWFGGEDDLRNWHALCRAVGVGGGGGAAVAATAGSSESSESSRLPDTEKGCERALRGTHVNLVDLVGWARREEVEGEGEASGGDTIQVFGSVGALAKYCKRTGKWFPLDEVAEAGENGDGNVVIRHLLRKLKMKTWL